MLIYGGDGGTREREYLFIDGGCLRSAVRAMCKEVFEDENAYQPLVQGLVGSFDKVFYYDAVSGRNHGEGQEDYSARVEPEHERFAQVQALDRVHVALGHVVGYNRRQKGVDVRLAVDMMTHAFRGKISRATLFAGDADFVPLLRALVSEGLHVTLWHPPQANKELKGAADTTRAFDMRSDSQCLTLNGRHPAFPGGNSGSGSIDLVRHGAAEIVKISGQRYIGTWDEELLTIFLVEPAGRSANYHALPAPGSTLRQALMAFQAVHGWDVAATGEQWVKAVPRQG